MKLGAHMSTSGGAWRALQRGRSIRCDVVQVFVKNNMQWFGKPISPQDLALYATERAANHFARVFGHAGYLINLGSPAQRRVQMRAQKANSYQYKSQGAEFPVMFIPLAMAVRNNATGNRFSELLTRL